MRSPGVGLSCLIYLFPVPSHSLCLLVPCLLYHGHWHPTPYCILDHSKPVNLPSPKLLLSGILATEMITLIVMAENSDDKQVEEREGSHSSVLPQNAATPRKPWFRQQGSYFLTSSLERFALQTETTPNPTLFSSLLTHWAHCSIMQGAVYFSPEPQNYSLVSHPNSCNVSCLSVLSPLFLRFHHRYLWWVPFPPVRPHHLSKQHPS